MTRPVVGIIACTRRIGSEFAQAAINRYVDAAMRFGDADAVLVPALPDLLNAANIVARLDGILLTGSPSNIEPARYGDAATGNGPFDPARDATVAALIAAATAARRPVFGVCRGFQEINVAYGGTLRRDLGDAALPHHAADTVDFAAMFDHEHDVALAPGGVLARAFGGHTVRVNSVHYQGVDRLGAGLTVEACAADGQIEAVSAEPGGAPLLAVQWHPEWATADHADRRMFFTLLGRALRGASLQELVP